MASSLVDLCIAAVSDGINGKDDDYIICGGVDELPLELLDGVLMRLTPLGLQKLQDKCPFELDIIGEHSYRCHQQIRKRRRNDVLDAPWHRLYGIRWPCSRCNEKINDEEEAEPVDDWQQMYWGRHMQECVDAVAETALRPSYDGLIGEIEIPDRILEHIGCNDHAIESTSAYLKFSYHCSKFGIYARKLELPNSLLSSKTCDLLHCSQLVSLEIQWIKANDDVVGLCSLLNRNNETLKSVYFIYCKLSPSSINAICDSLQKRGLKVHGVEHFTIKRSNLVQTDSSRIPSGFASFLTFGKHLLSLTLCDVKPGRTFGSETLNCLLDAPTNISVLDLSENHISGSFSRLNWRSSSSSIGERGLQLSLRVLNFRGCYLVKDDIYCLKDILLHLPNLRSLDLSDNDLRVGIRSLTVYFSEMAKRGSSFSDLKLEDCGICCDDATELLEVLSKMPKPINLLSLKRNTLGSRFGSPCGKFICTGISVFDIGFVGLDAPGFVAASKEITKELEIEHIDISGNAGKIEAARFISILVSHARTPVAVYAQHNEMPVEALSVISSGFKTAKGKLKHLSLYRNCFSVEPGNMEMEAFRGEFDTYLLGDCTLRISSLKKGVNELYDHDP